MKNFLTLMFVCSSFALFSQPWLSIGENRYEDLSFQDQQDAFYSYWQDKEIVNGYYIENGVEKKAYGWKQFKRWEHFWENRVDMVSKTFPTRQQYKLANHQFEQDKVLNRSVSGQWISLGPSSSNGGYAGVGRINCIAFHPSNTNTFWIGSPAGGLWGTTDGGNTWNVFTDQNEVIGVSAIAIPSDYNSSQTIYIGTGDRDARDNNSMGVLKSTDGGSTWNTTGLSFNPADQNQVTKLLMHPADNNTIYASTYTGIYVSNNAGNTWNTLSSSSYIIDMEFKPGDPNIIYASTLYNGNIYKVDVAGSSQNTVYNESSSMRVELAVTADNPNVVYAVVGASDNGLHSIIKSTNSGTSFSTVYNGPNILGWDGSGGDSGGQAWYDLAIEADPDNADIVYCGGINTWKSTDGGSSWNISNHWWGDGVEAVHADKHYLAYNDGILYECNDGGLYQTANGNNWTNISNGIVNSQMYKLGVSQTEANGTITGLQDNGTKLNHTDGNWYDVKGGDGMECLIDYSDYDIQYGTYVYGQITRTTDLWSSSTDIEPSAAGSGAWVTPYIIHPSNPSTLYAGYENVWKTTNRGDSWTQVSTFNSSEKVRSLAISESNPQVIYAADRSNIWKTTNDGGSWSDISSGLPSSAITSIAVKNDDANTVWVTLGSYNSDAVYQSTDGGSNWVNISTGIPNIPTNSIVQNKQNTSEVELYAGTDFGVYIKLGSANWQLFNTGMPKVVIGELDIYYDATPANSKLRAATYGRGLWESDLYSAPTVPAPVADFTANQTTISVGGTVNFTDLSSNTPTSWAWEFESGTPATSNTQNPSVSYNSAGTFQVKLTASNAGGSDEETKLAYITVNTVVIAPVADFTISNNDICENESIQLTDQSQNSPDSWTWSITPNSGFTFINGTNANSQNPQINFTVAGNYTIELEASNSAGNDTETANLLVKALAGTPVFSETHSDLCEGVNVNFTVNAEANTTYNWSFPADWSGNSTTNSININIGSTSGDIQVIPNNACGDGPALSQTVNVTPLPETPVFSPTPDTELCENSSVTYTVETQANTDFVWSLPTGWTGSSTTNTIDVTSNNNGGTVEVYAENSCGVSSPASHTVSMITSPTTPSSITGATEVCETSTNTYSVVNVNGVSYNWSFPSDWSGTSSTNSIDITTGASSGNITVNAVNACGSSPSQSLEVNILPVPQQVTDIWGDEELCVNSTETYITQNIPNVNYIWTLPSGWSGSSTTNSIEVTAGQNSGNISVVLENTCGTSPAQSLSVNVIAGTAAQPSVISGPNPVCSNSPATFSVTNVPGVTYFWEFPTGWSGTGNTNSIDVNTGNTGGTITLVPFNACGIGTARTLNVSVQEAIGEISVISGPTEICENMSYSYSVNAANASEYVWTLPNSWSGSSSFENINITAGNESGTIEVTANNACGSSSAASLDVNLTLQPIANFTYTSNQSEVSFNNLSEHASSYHWNFGDGNSSTTMHPIHEYAQSGIYNVVLTAENECAQKFFYSDINITNTSQSELDQSMIQIYPNPTQGQLFVNGLEHGEVQIRLSDATGKSLNNETKTIDSELIIEMEHLTPGAYQLTIIQSGKLWNKTIILQ